MLAEIDQLLNLHFPDEKHANGPAWRQRPYMDDLFRLATGSAGEVSDDDLREHIDTQWKPQRTHRLTSEQERQLETLLHYWDAWQLAYEKLRKPS